MVWDGAAGIDIAEIGGPSYNVMDGRTIKSFEKIDIENGAFDTFVFLQAFIDTADHDEVEVIADRFDTIVLDPFLEWSRTADATTSQMIFEALVEGQALQVRTALDSYVVGPANDSFVSTGRSWPASSGSEGGVADQPWVGAIHRRDETRYLIRWSSAGTMTPETLSVDAEHGVIELDMRNGLENRMRLDLAKLAAQSARRLDIIADPYDEVFLVQSECWSDVEPMAAEFKFNQDIRSLPGLPFAVSAHLPAQLAIVANAARKSRIEAWTDSDGFFYLSADVQSRVDSIDLTNGKANVLMVRNDGRLLSRGPIRVSGDPGVDGIWLEGSAGWRIEHSDSGATASVPLGAASMIKLELQPGLNLRILPTPPYVSDPMLADVSAYPGLRDERSTATNMIVSRGGYVRLSTEQLHGKSRIDVTNGIANVVELSPTLLAGAEDRVEVMGDRDLDLFLPIDLTAISGAAAGTTEWRASDQTDAPRPNQRVIVHGLDIRLRPNSVVTVE
jgi:hypothetical protein